MQLAAASRCTHPFLRRSSNKQSLSGPVSFQPHATSKPLLHEPDDAHLLACDAIPSMRQKTTPSSPNSAVHMSPRRCLSDAYPSPKFRRMTVRRANQSIKKKKKPVTKTLGSGSGPATCPARPSRPPCTGSRSQRHQAAFHRHASPSRRPEASRPPSSTLAPPARPPACPDRADSASSIAENFKTELGIGYIFCLPKGLLVQCLTKWRAMAG